PLPSSPLFPYTTLFRSTASAIDDLVAEFRAALSDHATTNYNEVAEDLSRKIIVPLRRHLTVGEQLLVSPDATLNLLPFAALVDRSEEHTSELQSPCNLV